MTDYTDLIAKLEAAPEGSPKLDVLIAESLDWTFMSEWALSEAYWIAPDESQHAMPPAWTNSLDAAFTLVPEGWRVYALQQHHHGDTRWWAGVDKLNGNEVRNTQGPVNGGPALALCIAALKARAAVENEG